MKAKELEPFKPSGNFVKDAFAISDRVNRVSGKLGFLGSAAQTLGNHVLAANLYAHSEELENLAKAISEICSARTHADFQAAQRGTATILSTLAGGMRLASQDGAVSAAADTLDELARKETPQ